MRILAVLMVALFAIGPAYAGSYIVQKDTGSTVWRDADGTESPAGDSGLSVAMPAVSTASTVYVVSHKKGRLAKAYIITRSDGIGTSVIDFGVSNATTPSQFDPVTGTSANALGTITVSSGTGTVASTVFSNVSNEVSAGDVIAIHTDGASTAGPDDTATILVIIE